MTNTFPWKLNANTRCVICVSILATKTMHFFLLMDMCICVYTYLKCCGRIIHYINHIFFPRNILSSIKVQESSHHLINENPDNLCVFYVLYTLTLVILCYMYMATIYLKNLPSYILKHTTFYNVFKKFLAGYLYNGQ